MAQTRKSREELIRESMNSPKKIDETVEFKIPRSATQFDVNKHTYKCSCCGKGFNSQKQNFQKSASPLFQANDGYLPWCKECTDKYFILLTGFYSNNEEHAIEHFCQQVDWVYDIEPLKAAREISSDRSRISHYAAKKNLNTSGRKTYFDTLSFEYQNNQGKIIESREQVKEDDTSITNATINRWGVGFTEQDYSMLEEHYKMLKKANPNCDSNQEIFVKSLCHLNLLMMKSLKTNDLDGYAKANDQYGKTFTKAGLKTIQESDKNADDCWGVFMEQISQYTPEEYYKDKKMYEDMDGIKKQFERFVLRPLKNILCKTNERDEEFNVEDAVDE